MLVRINETAADYLAHPELPVRLGIAVPLLAPNEQGFPEQEELERLSLVEDTLVAETAGKNVGRLVLVITTSGFREFVSYVRDDRAARAAAHTVSSRHADYRVQHYTERDVSWKLYQAMR